MSRTKALTLLAALLAGCAGQPVVWIPPPGKTQAQMLYDEQACLQRAHMLTDHQRRIGVVAGPLMEMKAQGEHFAACAMALGYRQTE